MEKTWVNALNIFPCLCFVKFRFTCHGDKTLIINVSVQGTERTDGVLHYNYVLFWAMLGRARLQIMVWPGASKVSLWLKFTSRTDFLPVILKVIVYSVIVFPVYYLLDLPFFQIPLFILNVCFQDRFSTTGSILDLSSGSPEGLSLECWNLKADK